MKKIPKWSIGIFISVVCLVLGAMEGQFVEENTVTVNISRLKNKLQTIIAETTPTMSAKTAANTVDLHPYTRLPIINPRFQYEDHSRPYPVRPSG